MCKTRSLECEQNYTVNLDPPDKRNQLSYLKLCQVFNLAQPMPTGVLNIYES